MYHLLVFSFTRIMSIHRWTPDVATSGGRQLNDG